MAQLFLLGIALLVGGILLARWFLSASPASVLRALRWGLVVVALAVAAGLAITGKLGYALLALIGMIPALARWYQMYRGARAYMKGGRASTGQQSRVETASLAMTLDHDSGSLDGEVLRGPYRGMRLADLTQDEALDLLAQCRRDDPQAASLLETWLERTHGADWRRAEEGRSGPSRPQTGEMDRDEAYRILGLAPGADEEAVRRAYRTLIARFHPDHGGSDYIAAKINQAKDVLLGK